MLVFAAIALLLLPCPEAKEKKAEQCTRWTTKMGKCYAMYCGAHNYDEAEEVCKKANAHLVSIHSKVENRFIYQQDGQKLPVSKMQFHSKKCAETSMQRIPKKKKNVKAVF
ncbi:hypothetical protein Y032_0004g1915 [Ancylostoma ceylanicum]|uniref:C-type lectin domain-containing protein n=1 Tax=Ancylostoma ceylanicum TaxID=53326 RepID=A0A016VVL7_9BILA|nr:hypothetical protein Y032_0004g1915 [Ancylostoma ceylanicum]